MLLLLRCSLELLLEGLLLAAALLLAVTMLLSAMLLAVKAAMVLLPDTGWVADTVLVVDLSRCLTPPGVRIVYFLLLSKHNPVF